MREPRHHVVGVKGTWVGPHLLSNVALFCLAVDGHRDCDGREQVASCWPGLGTRIGDSWWRRLLDGAFASSIEEYADDIADSIRASWREGDALTAVGHSRGARIGVRVLQLLRDLPGITGGCFVAFDQVTSEGIAYVPDRPISLPPWMPMALDLVARDEQRLAFPHEPLRGAGVFRLVLEGAHGDAGGTCGGGALAARFLLAGLRFAGRCGLGWSMPGLSERAAGAPVIHHPPYMKWSDPRTWRPGRFYLKGPARGFR